MMRPSRGKRGSVATTRYVGWLRRPKRFKRSVTANGNCLRVVGGAANGANNEAEPPERCQLFLACRQKVLTAAPTGEAAKATALALALAFAAAHAGEPAKATEATETTTAPHTAHTA